MSNGYAPPMMIRIEFDHMKHQIIKAITGDHMKGQLDVAVESAISEIDFDGMVSTIVEEALRFQIKLAVDEAVRMNAELAKRCGEAVSYRMKAILER